MNLNDYLIPDFDLTGNLTTEDTLYGLLSDDEEITGYLGLIEDIALSELSDVTLTSPVNGQVLKYEDGTWVNANETGGGSADYNLLLNKPSINAVPLTGNKTTAELGLFSGDYDDLTNKPSLATVATTGNYNDLSNRPTIPAAQVNADWDAVAGVSQILNKPTIPAAQVNADWDAVSGVEEILNKPNLATVATSGDYDDLINKPTYEDFTSSATFNATPGSDTHFYKEGNIVYLYFQSASGTHATDEQLFTLPSGYRPLASLDGTFILNNSAYGVININAGTGVCKINFISSTTANGRVYCNIAYPVA